MAIIGTATLEKFLPGGAIDSRTRTRRRGLETLAESIFRKGLRQALDVRPAPDCYDTFQVIDGNRRLKAIQLLHHQGRWEKSREIPYTIGDCDDGAAQTYSMVANLERLNLHQVEEYEAFAARSAAGASVEEIAAEFGIGKRAVQQRLALGRLHQDIRDAWYEGQINGKTAMAFTLEPDQAEQLKLFERLQKDGRNVGDWEVRRALEAGGDAARGLKIVGIDNYVSAGGTVVEDLFGNEHRISDPDLARKMLRNALLKKADELKADGWSFARLRSEVNDVWNWRAANPSPKLAKDVAARIAKLEMDLDFVAHDDTLLDSKREEGLSEIKVHLKRLKSGSESYSDMQRKKLGCFISVDAAGDIKIEYGMQDPKAAKNADAAPSSKADRDDDDDCEPAARAEKPHVIPNSLTLALTEQLTVAASKTLATAPHLALALVCFALEKRALGVTYPMRISGNGYSALKAEAEAEAEAEDAEGDDARADDESFGDYDARVYQKRIYEMLDMPIAELLARFAVAASQAIDLRRISSEQQNPLGAVLLHALPPMAFIIEAQRAFDPERYFSGVNAAFCKEALEEMGVIQPWPKKKGELAALCVKFARLRDWLPVELRLLPKETAR